MQRYHPTHTDGAERNRNEFLSDAAYEMVLRAVDHAGHEPGNFGTWTEETDPDWAGWHRADLYFPDWGGCMYPGEPTGCWIRVQEQAGMLSYGIHNPDGSIMSCSTPKRVKTPAELDASPGMIELHAAQGRFLTES